MLYVLQLKEMAAPIECANCHKPVGLTMPLCGHAEHKPRPRDLTICTNCHHFNVFKDDLTLRTPTQEESESILSVAEQMVMDTLFGDLHARFQARFN